jgi:hypothetical protein
MDQALTLDERDRLTRNEVRIEVVCADVAEIKRALGESNARLRSIEQTLSEARGGWRAMMLLGGVAASLGAGFTHFLSIFWPR